MEACLFRSIRWSAFILGISSFSQEVPAFLSPGEDSLQPEIRAARNRRFNVRLPFSLLEVGQNGMLPLTLVDRAPIPDMPFDKADTVIIGELLNRDVFFTSDGKGLYTEDTIGVSEVVKAHQGADIRPQSRLAVLWPGGAGRLPDDRIIRHEIRGYVMPVEKQRYLFFLSADRPLQSYFVHKFWRIEKGILGTTFPEDARSSWVGKTVASLLTAWKSGALRN